MPYQAQLTLEKHFKNLAEKEEDSQRLISLWDILKKDLVERLSSSRSVFVYFSLHDATHSRKIITMIEMFLGEERISNLSPSDTFMLLCSAYAHDYGMALSADRVYQALGDDKFLLFLKKQSQNPIQEERDSFKMLLELVKGREDKTIKEAGKKLLQEIYRAILLALQQYLRPLHSYGVISLEKDLGDLLHGRIDRRIINSIVQICRLHGSSADGMMEMEKYANGLESGIYHPRFIAAMLRLGDLLDLDNGRFPLWFNGAVDEDSDFLPESSRLHYQKHESVTHFYVGPKKIQIVFHCGGSDAVKVARLADHWLSMLREECDFLTMHWSEITPSDFGRPPYLEMGDIYIKDESYPEFFLYTADDKKLQMQMPQQKVLELLEGTNIYNDRYIGIRELVQNAVDASLLQMWYDLTHNKYAHLIGKQEINSMTDFTAIPSEIFKFYNIKIELIRDLDENEIFVVVKDRGTGIGEEDLDSMANIGQGKEKNERLQRILHSMPEWMKPAGIFGIGLQSVFQLTDQINFYTRQPNRPEYKIVFNSYGKDMGRIEKQEIHDHDVDGDVFYDNYSQGTNVKFAIKREHLWENRSEFQYYDWKFDKKDEFNAIYAEMAHVIDKKLKETPFDYFNVEFCTMTIKNKDKEETSHHNRVYGFFRESENKRNEAYKYRLSTLQLRYENAVNNQEAIFWIGDGNAVYYDKADKLFYRIEALPCIKCSEDQKRSYFHLPCRKDKSLRVWYKFSKIEDISVLTDVPLHVPVFSGLLQMDIIIFDYPADKYLNIDRNHLRNQDNLTRDKIEKIQEKIFTLMCLQILEQGDKGSNKVLNDLRVAVTLLLLFKRYVNEKNYQEYIALLEKRYAALSDIVLCIGQVKFPVSFFVYGNGKFQIVEYIKEPLSDDMKIAVFLGKLKNYVTTDILVEQIPSSYFRVTQMQTVRSDRDFYMLYSFYIRKSAKESKGNNCIQMNDGVRLLDYCEVLEAYENNKSVNFKSLIKRLFKPDQEFELLAVGRAPKSFRVGGNLTGYMERGIDSFILSPFEKNSSSELQRSLKVGNCDPEEIFKALENTEHFEKCVQYVERFHRDMEYTGETGLQTDGSMHEKIVNEYKRFVFKYCALLKENYDWVKKFILENDRRFG